MSNETKKYLIDNITLVLLVAIIFSAICFMIANDNERIKELYQNDTEISQED